MPFLKDAFDYIANIKVNPNKLAIESKRKTPFLGFLTLISSIEGIYKEYVKVGHLKYNFNTTFC